MASVGLRYRLKRVFVEPAVRPLLARRGRHLSVTAELILMSTFGCGAKLEISEGKI